MNLFVTIPFVKSYRLVIPYAGKGQDQRACADGRLGVMLLLCLVGALIVSPVRAAPGDPSLPQRNLLVEWRVNGMTQSQKQQRGVRSGQLIVDSRGNIVGRTDIGINRTDAESRSASTQQLRVINGGRARLFVGQTQPHLVWQWAWVDAGQAGGGTIGVIGPVDGSGNAPPQVMQPRLTAQTVWIDIGQGLYVRPSWPGGRAPVLVELDAQMRQPVSAGGVVSSRIEPDGQTRRVEVSSTLSVPLGQWSVVARSGGRTQRQQSGVLSTRELDSQESEQLEIRITAP